MPSTIRPLRRTPGFTFLDGHSEVRKWHSPIDGFRRRGGEVLPNDISWLARTRLPDHTWFTNHIAAFAR